MIYYKDRNNEVYAFNSDGTQDRYISDELIRMTDIEVSHHLNPIESNDKIIARLQSELDTIERNELMPRKTREIQIQLMEFLAVQQGITPEQLALNPAYAGMKQVDAQCVVLRAQIRELL